MYEVEARASGSNLVAFHREEASVNSDDVGVVVVFGVAFSTVLSLLVVPAAYTLLAPFTKSPESVAHELEKLEGETPSVGGHG